jgi:hypothetical protein
MTNAGSTKSPVRRKSPFGKSNIHRTESGNIVHGVFTPVLAKHSKTFLLIDCISVVVDRMQRNFEPMRKQVEAWQRSEVSRDCLGRSSTRRFVEGNLSDHFKVFG